MARRRNLTFFSLGELNDAVRRCLTELNARPFQKMSGSRIVLFKELDQPVLRSLPAHRYELGAWRQAKVNIDYHVQVDWHCYSVPYSLTQQQVEVRLSARTVEIFHKGRRVAAHARSRARHGFTTDPAHRPKSHQKHLAWTPSRLIDWARTITTPSAAVDPMLNSDQQIIGFSGGRPTGRVSRGRICSWRSSLAGIRMAYKRPFPSRYS